MILVPCTEPYWEFVRTLRMDERVEHGFIEKADITSEQQKKYMAAHWPKFFIALVDEVPAGFVGCINGDIRDLHAPGLSKERGWRVPDARDYEAFSDGVQRRSRSRTKPVKE